MRNPQPPMARRSIPWALILLTGLVAGRGEGASWLPAEPAWPGLVADPESPRTGVTWIPDPDRFDGSLGARFPMVEVRHPWGPATVVLEGGALFRLARDGAFFPLQTFDGRLGLSWEGRLGRFLYRARAVHWSAHRADGDTAVAYRGMTFSREAASVEAGWREGAWLGVLGVAASWHAVPRDRGPAVRAGAQYLDPEGACRPFVAAWWAADAERAWRATRIALAGVETGSSSRWRVALRYQAGPRPHGQHWLQRERYLGLDLSFFP